MALENVGELWFDSSSFLSLSLFLCQIWLNTIECFILFIYWYILYIFIYLSIYSFYILICLIKILSVNLNVCIYIYIHIIFSHWHKLIYRHCGWHTHSQNSVCWESSNLQLLQPAFDPWLTRWPTSRSSVVPAWSIWKAPGTSHLSTRPLFRWHFSSVKYVEFLLFRSAQTFVLLVSQGSLLFTYVRLSFLPRWNSFDILYLYIFIYINVFECLFTRYSGTSIQLRWRIHFRKNNGWNLKILFQGALSFSGEPFYF